MQRTDDAAHISTDHMIAAIAQIQRDRAEVLAEAAKDIQTLEGRLATLTRELCQIITPETVQDATDSLGKHRVNVGDLDSRISDRFEEHGVDIYPESYRPIHSNWALVSD